MSAINSRYQARPIRDIVALLLSALAILAGTAPLHAADIRVFSGGAPQQALRALAPAFEKATGHHVQFTFALVTALQQKLASGERADLILLPIPLIASSEKAVALRPEGRVVLARVGIGVIVREGASRPNISTREGVRRALLDARAVALPEPNTPSGAHLNRMIGQLGIGDEVRARTIIKAAIDGGPELVAKGEAELGMYLLSEVQAINGIQVAGLLPPQLQSFVVYGTAIPAHNGEPEPALAFIKWVSDSAKSDVWRAAGFELMTDKK